MGEAGKGTEKLREEGCKERPNKRDNGRGRQRDGEAKGRRGPKRDQTSETMGEAGKGMEKLRERGVQRETEQARQWERQAKGRRS